MPFQSRNNLKFWKVHNITFCPWLRVSHAADSMISRWTPNIYIYRHLLTDFHCITTLQYGKTCKTLQAGIETCLTLNQADDIPLVQACSSASAWELMHIYQILFVNIFALSDARVLNSLEEFCNKLDILLLLVSVDLRKLQWSGTPHFFVLKK